MTRPASLASLLPALLFAAPSVAQEPPATAGESGAVGTREAGLEPPSSEDRLGAVLAPVTLPDGATSLYGYAGAPELGVGFRQGISGFELEARARMNWFQLSAALELGMRVKVLERGALTMAPTLGLGVVFNSGATYMDDDNFSGVLLRLSPGLITGWRVAETVTVLGLVDVPVDVGLSKSDSRRVQVLGGGGAEVYLGNDLSVLVAGQLGVESFRERQGVSDTRLGWNLRVGLGARLF
ncbi:hypothetical protein LZ198_36800 [Myxococcus sp. K15C18031901]|uniref:hypothetical protein n=1 Tax=Myxococcus dinghuensis TaxID=2906761 RepID=UPI0020A7E952|nr:hypothetical protein [Myxococcus dinghuensis]MCP3104438.1 hypothetical protein [Myxococcus dinghuensis]